MGPERCELERGSYLIDGGWPHAADIKLDPGFKEFYRWCKDNGVPVIIVSS